MTVGELLDELSANLGARHEALALLEEVTGERAAALYLRLGDELANDELARLQCLTRRRRRGEPLQHVIGHWGFRHLDLLQDGRALVVRPETEIVVEVALAELRRLPPAGRWRVLDLGTGSGAIACALVDEVGPLEVLALDRSCEALELASANRRRLGDRGARLQLLAADWTTALCPTGRFDLVVSNPPYLSEAEWSQLDTVVRDFDPRAALVAGTSGLEAYQAIFRDAPSHLRPGGVVVCEIGATQGGETTALAAASGASAVEVHTDLAGRDRVLVARYDGAPGDSR